MSVFPLRFLGFFVAVLLIVAIAWQGITLRSNESFKKEAGNPRLFSVSIIRILDSEVYWGAFRFGLEDFLRWKNFTFEGLVPRSVSGFSEKFVPQGFCSNGNDTFVAGGKAGMFVDGAKIFHFENDGTVSSYLGSPEYRFRNCAFGNVGWPVFGAVTHGTWSLVIRRISDGREFSYEFPRLFPEIPEEEGMRRLSFSHFLAFSDLDGDGIDEAYASVTSPNFQMPGAGEPQELGTVYRLAFSRSLESYRIEDVWISGRGYVRRILKTSFFWIPGIWVLYEWAVSKEGKRMPPKLYHFVHENGRMVQNLVFEVPSEHRECKEISESAMFAYPTVQIGCDKAKVYVLRRDGDWVSLDRTVDLHELALRSPMAKTLKSNASWENLSVHMISSGDWDGDGTNETVISVNNDGLYLFDFFRSDEPLGKISFVPSLMEDATQNIPPVSESYLIMDSTVLPH